MSSSMERGNSQASSMGSEETEHKEEHEVGYENDCVRDIEKNAARPASVKTQKDKEGDGLERTLTASSQQIPAVKVPRKDRSGLLAQLTIVYEAEEPKNYPRNIKWFITFWIAVAASTAPMGSSIILHITDEFSTTSTIANLSVALYMLSMSVFPLWWSAFSESAGRRTVYLTAFLLYTIFNIAAAKSTSIGMFIAFRFLSGGTSASVQAVDCWEVKERGAAMGIFYLGPLAGPLIAPILGGALTEGLGWRSTQWFQAIFGAVVLLAMLFFLPETHKIKPEPILDEPTLSRMTSRQSVALKTRKWVKILRNLFIEPLLITRYLRFPAVALTVTYASITFGCLYFLNISIEKTFSGPRYDFSVIAVGCLYISNSLGYLVTSVFGGRWVDYIMAREARNAGRIDHRGKLILLPEDRMRENAWLGAVLLPISLLWYGWTAQFGVYWFVPILANFFFGVGTMLLFAAATTMLTEFMPKKASNGVALNNFVRNIFAFLGSFLAEPLINAIGNGWLMTILAAICVLSMPIIWLMKRNGPKWREVMDREMD